MEGEVLYTEFAEVPYRDYWNVFWGEPHPQIFSQISIVNGDGNNRPVNSDDRLTFFKNNHVYDARFSHIENGKLYIYWANGNMFSSHFEINVNNPSVQKGVTLNMGYGGDRGAYNQVSIIPLSYNFELIWFGSSNINQSNINQSLYYYKVPYDKLNDVKPYTNVNADWGYDVDIGDIHDLVVDNKTLLLSDCKYDGRWFPDYYFDPNNNTWTVTTLASTKTYTVRLKNQNGEEIPELVEVGNYVAEATNVIILKPINKK
jgi:hypothetical protein